jgi:hypothetical protein
MAPAESFSDSLVSSQVYEIIKTVYSSPDSSASSETRVSVLQNTLGQLRLANIATLDAITTHFTRLIELTSADEPFITLLAQTLAPCVLRPRIESPLTMHERHAYRLIRDLFDHKEAIFGELKRASSLNHGLHGPSNPRPRAPSSTDESNRRANMEARTRAIVEKTRSASPAPGPNGGHRRDRSVGRAETRFPVVTSPTAATDPHRRIPRHSLEVPGEHAEGSPPADGSAPGTDITSKPLPEASTANGASEHAIPAATGPTEEKREESGSGVEKKNSLGRSGHVAAAASRLNRKGPGAGSGSGLERFARQPAQRDSVGSLSEALNEHGAAERPHGVELTDKAMDY